jgi:outer membrane protein assembly factor BamB
MYDAFTGNWILDIVNVPLLFQTAMGMVPVMFSENGDMLVYVLDGVNGWLAMWNSSKCVLSTVPVGTGEWAWRPPMGASLEFKEGVQWNVTIPQIPGGEGQYIQAIDSNVLLAVTGNYWAPTSSQLEIGYDATTGRQLWSKNVELTPGTTTWELMGPAGEGVYTEFTKETLTWSGYNIATGDKLWGPTEPYTNAWGMYYETYMQNIAYGKLYASGYDGVLHCYDVKTGTHLWDYSTGSSGLETPYGTYPVEFMTIADGKVYICTGNHHAFDPMFKGERLHCVDAETGKLVWSISGWWNNMPIADGYLTTLNLYDQQIYCFGKGQTAMTVSTPDTVVPQGTSVVIKGTVRDQSPGAKGTPAISDASMSQWMEYLYMQQPKPTNATGVPVTLTAIGPSGNNINIATVTSDANGHFACVWTPPNNELYTIIATFSGTNSYFSSSAETSLAVSAASASSSAPLDLYIIVATIVIIIAIAIAVVVLSRRK